eukprot:1101039-Pleurochrysis_carterae.AAC.1
MRSGERTPAASERPPPLTRLATGAIARAGPLPAPAGQQPLRHRFRAGPPPQADAAAAAEHAHAEKAP